MDIVLLVVTAPVWIPLLAAVALVVRWKLGAPVLFRQLRPGRNERLFELLKFRTMTNASGPGAVLLPDAERLTPFGRALRATSLDELPELLNILRGEMSLVGPRPLLVQYLPLYSPRHRARHLVPPGLTGLAQVNGRNAVSWPDRFDFDVEYVRRNSLTLDLSILVQTIATVLRRQGITEAGHETMSGFSGYDLGD